MAKQTINPGAAPIVWSTVDEAFRAINDNFTELYLTISGGPGSVIDLTDLGSNLVPRDTEFYDLGSAAKRWKDLYLSGSSLYLGSAVLTATGSSINLPAGSTVGGAELDNEYFREIVVAGQSTIVADAGGASALTLVAGNAGITLTTNATTDTLTITNSGILSVSQGLGITVTGSGGSLTVTNSGVRTLTPAVGGGISITGTNDLTISNTGVLQVTTFGGSGITINNPSPGVFEFVNSLPNVQQDTFRSILVAGQSTVQADSAADNLILVNGTGINITTDATTDTITITNTGVTSFAVSGVGLSASAATGSITLSNTGVTAISAGDGISINQSTGTVVVTNTRFGFTSIAVGGQASVLADNATDTLVLVAGEGIQLTTNAVSDSITFDVTYLKGSVFSDTSTLVINGATGEVVGPVATSSLRTTEASIYLGFEAGSTSTSGYTVGIGYQAQKTNPAGYTVAIGSYAGEINQGQAAVAVGSNAGESNQGINAVAIGNYAGQTNQSANSIIINAFATPLNGVDPGFYVSPIREVTGPQVLYYDPSGTKEITWGPIPSGIGGGGGGDFELNVASDDSTLRRIFSGETLKFIGGSGITTSSDGEGAITISATAVSGLASRSTAAGSTGSIANAATANVTVTGFKGYLLYKIQTSAAAWVRVYTSIAARTADSGRLEGVDPSPGAGVITEVITTGAETILITPGTVGFNDESPVDTNIQLAVTNKSGGSANITVTLIIVKVED
jgi:hypothetical protein